MEEDEHITELKKNLAVSESLLDLFMVKQSISVQQFNKIYDKIKGVQLSKLDGFNLKLDMSDESDRKMVGIMGRLRLPDLGLLKLSKVGAQSKGLTKEEGKSEVNFKLK